MPVIKGDPFGSAKDPNFGEATAQEVNAFHEKADTDSSQRARHHTLGSRRNQASPGDHSHTGSDGSTKLGSSLAYSLTGDVTNASLAEVDNTINQILTMLATWIEFVDNRTP